MIKGIIDERKKLFNGGNYRQYVKVHGTEIPSIVIVIDNFAGFKERQRMLMRILSSTFHERV